VGPFHFSKQGEKPLLRISFIFRLFHCIILSTTYRFANSSGKEGFLLYRKIEVALFISVKIIFLFATTSRVQQKCYRNNFLFVESSLLLKQLSTFKLSVTPQTLFPP